MGHLLAVAGAQNILLENAYNRGKKLYINHPRVINLSWHKLDTLLLSYSITSILITNTISFEKIS